MGEHGNQQISGHASLSNLWCQPLNGNTGSTLAYLCKIIVHLHPKPRVSSTAKCFFKTDGHFGRNVTAPCNHIMKLLAGNAKPLGSFGNTQAKIVKTLLDEKAGMH